MRDTDNSTARDVAAKIDGSVNLLSRRSIMQSTAALATTAAVLPFTGSEVGARQEVDVEVHRLWHEYRENNLTHHALVEKYHALYETLPEWARSGPIWIKTDPDAFVPPTIDLEAVTGWPAWDEPIPMLDGLALSRPSPRQIRGIAKLIKRHEEWQDEPDAARKFYRVMLRKIRERQREKEREERKLGIFDIDAQSDYYCGREAAIRDAIFALDTPSYDKIAAMVMVGLASTSDAAIDMIPADECKYETGFAMYVLEALRPMLTGQIKADVADILDYPQKSWGDRTWFRC